MLSFHSYFFQLNCEKCHCRFDKPSFQIAFNFAFVLFLTIFAQKEKLGFLVKIKSDPKKFLTFPLGTAVILKLSF